MANRMRIDRLLVERGLFESRAKAQAAIAAGLVTADGTTLRKPSDEVDTDAEVHADAPHPWVSRGGVKLAAALDRFRFEPGGHVCLDVGASTGGFTDVLLTRGARRVYAVDVGHDQLHARLRARPEVTALEWTDIRRLAQRQLPEPPEAVVIDVSFIPLKLVLPPALALVREPALGGQAWLVALIKPQFEAGPRDVKKGIVRDPQVHDRVCVDVVRHVTELGWTVTGVLPSPIAGGDGNREFLLGATRG
jgi:23S rRNA (cytidine1920-2'-O)/16S rRNA (cytidine1409-2'-O)-methyltransferase